MKPNPRPGSRRGRALLLAVLVCFVLSGCGASGSLTGTVTWAGKKVVSGTVAAFDADGGHYYGKIQSNGSYAIKDIPPGRFRLTVASPNPRGGTGKPPRPGVLKVPIKG